MAQALRDRRQPAKAGTRTDLTNKGRDIVPVGEATGGGGGGGSFFLPPAGLPPIPYTGCTQLMQGASSEVPPVGVDLSSLQSRTGEGHGK